MAPMVYNQRSNAKTPVPRGAIYVGRPTVYGNPFTVTEYGTSEIAIEKYKEWIAQPAQVFLRKQIKRELRGKNLVCWCSSPDNPKPCHADILIHIANED